MERVDDGELYLEIEGADADQLRRGLIAARKCMVEARVDIAASFAAHARIDRERQTKPVWTLGRSPVPDGPSEDEMTLADAVDSAWLAAVSAAGFQLRERLVIGKFGLVDREQMTVQPPVVRDLFEAAD